MLREYEPNDLEDLRSTWAAASAVAHPFLSDEFLIRGPGLPPKRHAVAWEWIRDAHQLIESERREVAPNPWTVWRRS